MTREQREYRRASAKLREVADECKTQLVPRTAHVTMEPGDAARLRSALGEYWTALGAATDGEE